MADLDAFENPAPEQQTTEEDPAAAFLAREQDDLKGLEDDNFGTDNGTQGTVTDLEDELPSTEIKDGRHAADDDTVKEGCTPEVTMSHKEPAMEDNLSTAVERMAAVDDYDPFGAGGQTQQTDDFLGGQATSEPQVEADDGFGMPNNTEEGPTDSYSAISHVDKLRAEPEKIKIWREENARRIEKKDEEETKRVEEWREIAKKELDDWYKHHDEQLSKTKENNRESEAAFVAERDQTQPGEEWEKICRLCEFNPKNSKNTKDISRMRSILLQLKQTPLVR